MFLKLNLLCHDMGVKYNYYCFKTATFKFILLLNVRKLYPKSNSMINTIFLSLTPIHTLRLKGSQLPIPRWGSASVTLANSLVLVGGYGSFGDFYSIVEYTPETESWITWESTLIEARLLFGAVLVDLKSFPDCK
jgi:hypothetical protein